MAKTGRNDQNFERWCREMATIRVANRLAKPLKEEISLREMQSLMMRTDSWKKLEEEMKTKPKRENMGRLF